MPQKSADLPPWRKKHVPAAKLGEKCVSAAKKCGLAAKLGQICGSAAS